MSISVKYITEKWKEISSILAIMSIGASAAVWAYDVENSFEQVNIVVASIASRVDARDFRTLEEIRQIKGLTAEQYFQWCQLRQQFGMGPCTRPFTPDPQTGRMK